MAKATKKAAKKTAKKAPNKAVKSNGAPKGDAPAEQNDGPPSLNILGQYLKDLDRMSVV